MIFQYDGELWFGSPITFRTGKCRKKQLIIISNTFIQEWRGHTVKETVKLVENVLEVEQFIEKVKNSPAVQ